MGKRFDSLVFPGGKSRAFTLSYDDGVVQDRRLAEIFRERGLKCTFNIGSGLFGHKDGGSLPGKPPPEPFQAECGGGKNRLCRT